MASELPPLKLMNIHNLQQPMVLIESFSFFYYFLQIFITIMNIHGFINPSNIKIYTTMRISKSMKFSLTFHRPTFAWIYAPAAVVDLLLNLSLSTFSFASELIQKSEDLLTHRGSDSKERNSLLLLQWRRHEFHHQKR